jgi:hypothetical protein
MKVILKIIIIFFLLFTCQKISAIPNDSAQKISVDVDIIAKTIEYNYSRKTNIDKYFLLITLTNTQDSTIHLRFITCGWNENFTTNNDSIYMPGRNCDLNYPIEIKLEPHKSITFYGEICSLIKNVNDYCCDQPKFKIGFIDFPNIILDDKEGKEMIWRHDGFWITRMYDKRKCKIYWSDEILLKSRLYEYKIEK